MNECLSVLNPLAAAWATAFWRASCQGAAVLTLTWLITRSVTGMPADARCWLWRLAYLKLLLALCWAMPIDLPLLPARPAPPAQQPPAAARTAVAHAPPGVAAPSPRSRTATGAPTRPLSERAVRPSWELGLFFAWTLGVGWQVERLRRRQRQSAELSHEGEPCRDAATLECFSRLCRRFRLGTAPELCVAPVPGPLLCGVQRPRVLLPAGLEVSDAEREWVLAHELAHLRRHDLWWSGLATGAQVLFFFHPAVWLAHREARLAQEMACDALTLRVTAAPASRYGELLVRMVTRCAAASEAGPAVAGILETGTPLERRLKVLPVNPNSTRRQAMCAGMLLTLALAGIIPWRVSAQASPAPTPRLSRPAGAVVPPAASPSHQPAAPHTLTARSAPPAAKAPKAAPLARKQASAPAQRPAAARPARAAAAKPAPHAAKRRPSTPPTASSPNLLDAELLQAAGVNVGPYAALIATLTPEELVQYVETEHQATQTLLENTLARVRSGAAPTAELVPLETKKAQLDILIQAAQRRVQTPPANRPADLFAALTPAELVQFLSTELNGARSLRDLAQARFQAGIAPSTELLPLEARTQQLEILVRAAQRRAAR